MKDAAIRNVLVSWFGTAEDELTKRQAKNGVEGAVLREYAKERMGLTRDGLAEWIDRLLAEGILTEKKVVFEGSGRPKKILSLCGV